MGRWDRWLRRALRVSNRSEAWQMRRLGASPLSALTPGHMMVLETVGRRSGMPRYTPVAYVAEQDGSWLIGNGAAGLAREPDWSHNLRADTHAAGWLGRKRVPVTATELHGADWNAARQRLLAAFPRAREYERRAGREIAVFRLTPT